MKTPEINFIENMGRGLNENVGRNLLGLASSATLIATTYVEKFINFEPTPSLATVLMVGIPVSILVDAYFTGREENKVYNDMKKDTEIN